MEPKRISLGRTSLQIIAVLTMFCDHFACVFIDSQKSEALYQGMRIVGRISFPLFCFLLVEGFFTTSNVKKYLSRILLFAILSEVPFDLAFFGSFFYPGAQNVIFTMLIGLLVLVGLKNYETNMVMEMLFFIVGCVAAYWLHTDYSYMGIALIVVFYLQRNHALARLLWAVFLFFIDGGMQVYAILAMPFCSLYRMEKQERRLPRYFLYVFYPVHLLVLWGISVLI